VKTGGWIVQCVYDVLDADKNETFGRGKGHRCLGWEPRERVTDTRGAGVLHPYSVAPVRLKRRARVPPIGAMWRPRGAPGGFDVHQDANGAGRCQGRPIEIKVAVELGMGGKFWNCNLGPAQEIKRVLGLVKHLVPQVRWKILINTAQTSDKVVF
jgi:hypothetical protein